MDGGSTEADQSRDDQEEGGASPTNPQRRDGVRAKRMSGLEGRVTPSDWRGWERPRSRPLRYKGFEPPGSMKPATRGVSAHLGMAGTAVLLSISSPSSSAISPNLNTSGSTR